MKSDISSDLEISEARIKPRSWLYNPRLSLFLHDRPAKTSSQHNRHQHFPFVSYATSTCQIALDIDICASHFSTINFLPPFIHFSYRANSTRIPTVTKPLDTNPIS